VRLADIDRSVNDNGLQVFGTVTKDPVATGAELVAYSGFSASNYLEQPYNSDLDFGTGDFCFAYWTKRTNSTDSQQSFERAYYSGGYSGAAIRCTQGTSTHSFAISDDGLSTFDTVTSLATSANNWVLFVFQRSGNTLEIYQNGELVDSTTITNAAGSLSNASATLVIGGNVQASDNLTQGDLSLFRISATAPTAAQIKKMYNDEKYLFQENADATLYGSSDTVTALAYDDRTELLHAGTSAGRSVFQGLRRVDNTTDAVGATISASNGLVADD
ncbi:MAG: LamG domain-containing protein, partial [Candidatus Poseidoniales archaeon]